MRKPRQHLVIGGVDIFDAYGAVMTDEYELGYPEVRTVLMEVEGRSGAIDLTEAVTGDVAYGTYEMVFQLLFPGREFWPTFRRFANAVHGRESDFQIRGIDDEGVYHGRFAVDEHYSKMHYGVAKLKVTVDPFRLIGTERVSVSAAGGADVTLVAGRDRVQPTLTVNRPTAVIFGGAESRIEAGTWHVDGLWVGDEPVHVFVDTAYEQFGDVVISSLGNISSIATKRVCDVSWSSRPTGQQYTATFEYDVRSL